MAGSGQAGAGDRQRPVPQRHVRRKDQLALAGRPERDRVALRHLRPEPEVRVRFVTRLWASVVVWDILQQLVAYERPTEREPGAADEAAEGFAAVGNGAPAASGNGSAGNGSAGNGALPVVLDPGDSHLRLDDFANDRLVWRLVRRLVRRLDRRGVRAIPEPMSGLVESKAAERSAELVGLPTDRLQNAALRVVLPAIRKPLYARVRRLHPWLPQPDAQAMRRAAFELLDRHPIGEAPITLGSVLEAWGNGACDGVVVVGPWGCGPSLIAEGLLRHERDIPSLFLYADGSPIDGRRLDAFAFRLGAKGAFGDAALD